MTSKISVICLLSLLSLVYGSGELSILHSPKSIRFHGNSPINESLLKEVYSAALGFTTEKNSNWNGMYIQNPFNYPRVLVHFSIEGVTSLVNSESFKPIAQFPLHTDQDEYVLWKTIKYRILERYPEPNDTLIRAELAQGLSTLSEYPSLNGNDLHVELTVPAKGALKVEIEEDRKFLEEVALLNAIGNSIKQKDSLKELTTPHLYWFVLTGLHAVSDLHGPNSDATKQAEEILIEAMQKISSDFSIASGDRALTTVVTNDVVHTRLARSLLAKDENLNDLSNWNLAQQYDENYPIIFNIILWFGVAFFFSLLAIAIAISTMDPGRDSIIYRMTSNRMKKDN